MNFKRKVSRDNGAIAVMKRRNDGKPVQKTTAMQRRAENYVEVLAEHAQKVKDKYK